MLGAKITRVGDVGSGQLCKAVNQVVIAGTFAAVAEGLAFALASGVDPEATLEAFADHPPPARTTPDDAHPGNRSDLERIFVDDVTKALTGHSPA